MLRGAALVFVAGCSFHPNPGTQQGDDTPPHQDAHVTVDPDAPNVEPIDAPVPADAPQFCFGVGIVTVCEPTLPASPLVFDTSDVHTIDASLPNACTHILHQAGGGPDLCVIVAGTIDVQGFIAGKGPLPIVLVAADTLTIEAGGGVFVNSRVGRTGPGADATQCTAGNVGADGDDAGGAGGAGGTFGATGGKGGNGGNNGAIGGAASTNGGSVTVLRGGCPGANGGANVNPANNTVGRAGHGGGAVYLIAGTSLDIAGTVTAGGESGEEGDIFTGAGGGGTGGMIGLDSPSITIENTGRVLSGGGGGGEGGGQNDPGSPGTDADVQTFPAQGGGGNINGGNGGNGGAGSTNAAAGSSGDSSGGGGGGGGGAVGVIKTFGGTPSNAGIIAPNPS